MGPSQAACRGKAVLIRYPRGGIQDAIAQVVTDGFQLGSLGANSLADFLDELREVAPGMWSAAIRLPRDDFPLRYRYVLNGARARS